MKLGSADLGAPHKRLVVDVTVTSARTNSSVPAVGASLPLHGSLALGAQQAKLDVDLRTSSSLGTPSIQYVHDYFHPLFLRTGVDFLLCRLIPLIAWPSWWLLDVCQAWVRQTRFLRSKRYARMKEFVRRSTYIPSRQFLGDMRREFIQRLSVVLHGTLGSCLRDALQEGGAFVVACLLAMRA
jgi:hypothetical protein